MTTSRVQSQAKNKTAEPDSNGVGETARMAMPNVGAAGLMGGNALVMKHFVASSQELARFYSTRMKKDLSLVGTFATCKTPQDFAEVWYNAASSAVHDYADEFDRIVAIGLSEQKSGAQV